MEAVTEGLHAFMTVSCAQEEQWHQPEHLPSRLTDEGAVQGPAL